jgi:hypothetical protein
MVALAILGGFVVGFFAGFGVAAFVDVVFQRIGGWS